MTVENRQWKRPASSGREDIFSQLWAGSEKKAIVQIAHGMCEYGARYDEFARYLAENGYVVCMNDHAGHGVHAETLGYFGEEKGLDHVVFDMKLLMDEVGEQYQELPLFLLGHSMGSFLARKYCTIYGDELAGCIFSGTAGHNPALGLGKRLAAIQKKVKDPKSTAKILTAMAFGANNKKVQNPVNAMAWLSRDDEVCIAYAKDRYCGFPFTIGGYYDLFSLMQEVTSKKWPSLVPKKLPVYLLSGSEDPVGNYGRGPIEVYKELKATGVEDVEIKLYPGGRHEMFNEINKEEVYADALEWLDRTLEKTAL
jgi:alpha-beta hydrolase superfamily lysophospholipase